MKIKLFLSIVLAFTILFSFSQNIDDKYLTVENNINEGKFTEAIILLNELNKAYPNNYIYLENLGFIYDKIADPDNSIKYYTEALDLNSECVKCYAGLAKGYYDKNEIEKAEEYINKGLEINKETPFAYYIRGLIMQQKGKSENAISDFNKAILLDNQNDDYFIARANFYIKKSDLRNAYNDISDAIKLNPKNSQYFYYRSFISFNLNNIDESLNDISQAIMLNDSVSDYYNMRFSLYRDKKDYVNAEKSVLKSIELNPDDYNAYINLGDMYFETGEYSSYCNCYKNAESNIPESNNSMKQEIKSKYDKYCDENKQSYYYIRSLAGFNNKNYDNSISIAAEGIKLNNSCPILYNIKGSALLAKKNYMQAKIELEKCVEQKNILSNNITDFYNIRLSMPEIQSIQDSYLVKSYLGVAISELCLNNYDNASIQINKALEIAEALDYFNGIEYLYNVKAIILAGKNELSLSDAEISKALKSNSDNYINILNLAAIELLAACDYSPAQLKFEYPEELKIPRIIFPKLILKENKKSNINEIIMLCDRVLNINNKNPYAYAIKAIVSQLINDENACEYAIKAREYGLTEVFAEIGLACN